MPRHRPYISAAHTLLSLAFSLTLTATLSVTLTIRYRLTTLLGKPLHIRLKIITKTESRLWPKATEELHKRATTSYGRGTNTHTCLHVADSPYRVYRCVIEPRTRKPKIIIVMVILVNVNKVIQQR